MVPFSSPIVLSSWNGVSFHQIINDEQNGKQKRVAKD